MQITGLSSGLDTQSMIKDITAGYNTKKDNIWKEQKLIEYKQEEWKNINDKIYDFYKDSLFNSKLESKYKNSEITSSNERVATVTGKQSVGSQYLVVNKVASQTFLTGSKVMKEPIGVQGTIFVKILGEEREVDLTQDMTGQEVAKKLSEVGLEANFDKLNGRIFLASKMCGRLSDFEIAGDDQLLSAIGLGSAAVKMKGQDAEINYNGVNYTFDSNSFSINNLNFNIKDVGETRFTKDTDNNILETVKSFISDYNKLIKEIDTKLNANSCSLKPLTSQEKEVITESDAQEWNKKIKDSILRNDSDLSSLSSLFKNTMSQYVEIDSKKYNLSSIGINTGSYFTTSKNERGVLEINENKLKEMIKEDPDKVTKIVSSLAGSLYDKLTSKTKSSSLKSSYTFYNDKLMTNNYNEYGKKITAMTEKIQKIEDKYYKQFTKMEKAMSVFQAQQNYLSGFFNFK